jgi:hypothetical protein
MEFLSLCQTFDGQNIGAIGLTASTVQDFTAV